MAYLTAAAFAAYVDRNWIKCAAWLVNAAIVWWPQFWSSSYIDGYYQWKFRRAIKRVEREEAAKS